MSDDYIPMALWGKDHWSTLAYLETVMVDCGGFQIGADTRMRSNRRHCRLNDGSRAANHDDWMCVQDMAEAGLFTVGAEGVEPGQTLHLSELGRTVVGRLREHKAAGGQFATFKFDAKPAIATAA